jgi:hypothetical protein
MQIKWVLACVALVGSSVQGNSGHKSLGSAGTHAQAEPSDLAVSKRADRMSSPSTTKANMRVGWYLRDYPLSHYRRFPASVRRLMQRSDAEQDLCRNGNQDLPATYRACNRSWRASVELERRGWCDGNERNDAIMGDFHWLRCSRDRTFRPGQLGAHPPYSDREIHELTNGSVHR